MSINAAVIDFRCDGVPAGGLYFDSFSHVLLANTAAEVPALLDDVERLCKGGCYAVGCVAYEAAPAFDPALSALGVDAKIPAAVFAVAESPAKCPPDKSEAASSSVGVVAGGGGDAGDAASGPAGQFSFEPWQPLWNQQRYTKNFVAALEHIARGDNYQVNLTFPMQSAFTGDAYSCYRHLLAAQRGNYCGCLLGDDFSVISASPELFFARRGGRIHTRPMKGTAPRGNNASQDAAIAAELKNCPKQRAENAMIVDLLRNDIGRVCRSGSVKVESAFDCERYPTLWQMTSTVAGQLEDNISLSDIFRALFPCGSVTGAPKVMTTRIISQLEDYRRGIYCGAFGVVLPGGDCVFNVPIRTLQLVGSCDGDKTATPDVARPPTDARAKNWRAFYHVGSGVVADSRPDGEYAECLLKSRVLDSAAGKSDFKLLETIGWLSDSGYVLLGEHCDRMAQAADFFDFAFDRQRFFDQLAEVAQKFTAAMRVRVLASRDGLLEIESAAMPAAPPLPVRLRMAAAPIDISTPFIYHKTTRREHYEAFRRQLDGAFDMLLYNNDRQLTETTIANIAVKLDGRWLTPPVSCGLLPGVMRASLIAAGQLTESVITCDDLKRAESIKILNSLRGPLPAQLF